MKFTEKQLEDATVDAKKLLGDSPIVLQAYSAMVVALRIYAVSRGVLHEELTHGWTIANQPAVEMILGKLAQHASLMNYTNAELLADLQNSTVPYMQVVAANEAQPEEPHESEPDPTPSEPPCPVSGTPDSHP